ncbi:hypothetical protein IQ07DRAFT_676666 [Pyrenochaeta sp. DS3sAY3a]|nr:hypothetical protein IQ07DRAFT_676666 [Pyrenochaeta sp. DS3sAY3a]
MSQASQKSKAGCITCKIRKVKCDERKPNCARCFTTGRKCDGYQSNFRFFVSSENAPIETRSSIDYSRLPIEMMHVPSSEHVQYLARHFTIKPVPVMGLRYATGISYESEARATLCATSEPAVHHALVSLSTLRRVFEQSGGPAFKISVVAPGVQHGLQEYAHAIRSLVLRMSTHNTTAIRYSLVCCQLFMSIELALDDFTSATQHFVRGLRIMHQAFSRPYFGSDGRLKAAHSQGMPPIDMFAIKLFLTPSPDGLTGDFLFPEGVATGDLALPAERVAVRNANIQLADMGRSTLALLEAISLLAQDGQAGTLIRQRVVILENLRTWKEGFAFIEQSELCQSTARARLGAMFSMFFHVVLQAIVTLSLRPPGVEGPVVAPILEEMLQVAHRLRQLKQDVNAQPLEVQVDRV